MGGVDDIAGEEELGGALAADELGESSQAWRVGHEAAEHEQLAETGPLGRHTEVGHQRQLHAPADGRAVDGGDDGHVGVQQRVGSRE